MLFRSTEGAVRIFLGNGGFQMIEGLDRGAIGVMPGCSMFDIYLSIYNAWCEGNRPEALRLHNQLLAMLNHIRQDVEQIIHYEKRILARRGFIKTDYCRKPSFTPDAHFDRLFDEQYENLKPLFDSVAEARPASAAIPRRKPALAGSSLQDSRD